MAIPKTRPKLSSSFVASDVFRSIGCRYYANIIPVSRGSSPLLTPGVLVFWGDRRGEKRGGERRSNAHVHVHTRFTCVLRNSHTCSPPSFRSRPSGRNLWGLRARRGRRTRRKRDFSGTGVRKHRGPTESCGPSSPRDFRLDPDSRSFEPNGLAGDPSNR